MELGPETVVLLAGLVLSAVTDASTGRILNIVTFPMMALGVAIHATSADPWVGLVGLGAATLLHVPLWMGGIHKAGDAKLLMGVGACVGWRELLEATVWLAVLYVPIGIVMLAMRGQLSNLAAAARWKLATLRGAPPPGPPPEKTWMRTGPIVAAAGVIGWLTDLAVLH